ncbi:MAG: IreB family regulatory phosphoprotein [Firmicutes bacterium]|nr:IreB family regulatory phosphoprotein [Bacillota bacterium]
MFSRMDNKALDVKETLFLVQAALAEKGYDPLEQIVGYLVSGDPSYITAHGDARQLIRKIDRDDLLEEIVASYIKGTVSNPEV